MSIEGLFNTTFNLETSAKTDDGLGGNNFVWSIKTSNVPSRIRTVPAQFRTTNNKGEFVYTHKIWCKTINADIKTDRINHQGTPYEIVSVVPAYGTTGVDHYQIQVKEVK